MPELPEVETTVRGLARFLDGATITRVTVIRPDLRRPFPPDLVQALTGARVSGLSRRAKYGLIHTNRDHVMVFHLGMSGRWRIDPESAETHDHLVLETAAHRFALNDPRRFGSVDLLTVPELDLWNPFAALGPEPLGDALTAAHLRSATAGRKPAITLLLLDQRVVVGIGNIYASEILYRIGVHPERPAQQVRSKERKQLVATTKFVLQEAIAMNGTSISDFRRVDDKTGEFQEFLRVYGKDGSPCGTCGTPIQRIVQQQRSSFFCPTCQR